MSIHLIRLRKAWMYRVIGDDGPRDGTLDLPLSVHETPELAGMVLLWRGFATPPRSSEFESLAIRLEAVPGLRSVTLNEQVLQIPQPFPASLELQFANHRPRNTLRLEVDFDHARTGHPEGREIWGNIALAVRPS